MNFLGLEIRRKASSGISLDTLIRRLEAIHDTMAGVQVTPENCMQSPTVHAIVTRVSRRFGSMPVHVLRKVKVDGRESKERVPSHPVQRLLNKPNDWQTASSYWLDAASWLLRYGNHYSIKARGQTGPIRRLIPIPAGHMEVKQEDNLNVVYEASMQAGRRELFEPSQVFHARGTARDGVKGDSPVIDVRESIALEIAAERFGATVFGNGAMPGLIFEFMEGFAGFRTDEEREKFIDDFQERYTRRGRMRALLMPRGIKVGQQIGIENEKAQFLETRKLQRNIIAGAWGVPPHLVGDLERGTFSNIEHQSLEFDGEVILPYAKIFEAAMERDLLTDEDRRDGIIIRFNLDAKLRSDFKTRQEGLKIQREAGVINPNDWREREGMNPIPAEDGGDTYWQQGPSGQSGRAETPGDEENNEDEGDN